MLFNTIQFVFFLPAVILLYFAIPAKFRWMLLLAASYYFYMSWKLEYIFLIIFSTLIDYFIGLKMEKLQDKKARLPYLIMSLLTNFGLLFAFKYLNFFSENVNSAFQAFGFSQQVPYLELLLPVGISFYTFQTISYAIDVYSGKQKAERHLGYFALYVSFFPQLVAGPIERFSTLTPQLKGHHQFSYDNLANGLRLILYGLFVKMVIADNLSVYVDKIYAAPHDFDTFNILLGLCFYSFQIYCDFFGYSSIAVGSALIMGIKIMDNFKTPYLSNNIAEFWQRWHISLSTWFRDYLYFPMGGSNVLKFRWVLNVMAVFIVSGIWHGANWTFIIWGLLFGIVYLVEKFINRMFNLKPNPKPYSPLHILLSVKTFAIVTFIWLFFRSQNMGEAFGIIKLIPENISIVSRELNVPMFLWISLLGFILSDIFLYNKRFDVWMKGHPLVVRWGIYSILIFAIIVFSGVESFPFIYFQF
ncbi:MAG: MBOAT family protein [Bacteroidetes bacterium]|nr:MBOAT family protein [Bacteroidota bacterium]